MIIFKIRRCLRMISSSTLLSLIFAVSALAEGEDGTLLGDSRSDYIMKARNISGVSQVNADGNTTDDKKGTIRDDLYDSVIYVDSFKKKTNRKPYVQVLSEARNLNLTLATPASDIAAEEAKQEQERLAILAEEAKKKTEIPSYFGGGYCRMRTQAEVSKSSEFSTLSCLVDFGNDQYRTAEIFVGIYPDYEREMLIALPIYATFENGAKSNISGVVMTENKGSVNIADYIDNQRIRKLIGEAGLATNDVAYRYTVSYMAALQASKVQEEVQYVNTTDPTTGNTIPVPVVTRNVEPPKATEFFAAAGIELASQLFSIGTKGYLMNSDPLFKVYTGKRVWIEGIFEFDKSGIAKRYGQMSASEVSNIDKNNQSWKARRDATINKYGNKSGQSMESTLIQRQR